MRALLRIWQTLLLAQSRIPQAEREKQQRHTETDARDAQQLLRVLVRVYDRGPLWRSDRVLGNKHKGVSVRRRRQRGIGADLTEAGGELRRQDLRPDGAGNGAAERGSDVVGGEVDARDNGHVFVFRGRLDAVLCRVGEEPTAETEEALRADDASMALAARPTAVFDQQAEGDEEHAHAEDDVGFEVRRFEAHEQAEKRAGDDGDEAVERCDAGCRFDGFVEGDREDGVEVVAL